VNNVISKSDLFFGIHSGNDFSNGLLKRGCYTLSYFGGTGYFDKASSGQKKFEVKAGDLMRCVANLKTYKITWFKNDEE